MKGLQYLKNILKQVHDKDCLHAGFKKMFARVRNWGSKTLLLVTAFDSVVYMYCTRVYMFILITTTGKTARRTGHSMGSHAGLVEIPSPQWTFVGKIGQHSF